MELYFPTIVLLLFKKERLSFLSHPASFEPSTYAALVPSALTCIWLDKLDVLAITASLQNRLISTQIVFTLINTLTFSTICHILLKLPRSLYSISSTTNLSPLESKPSHLPHRTTLEVLPLLEEESRGKSPHYRGSESLQPP